MLGVAVFEKKADRAQVAALGFLEQGVFYSGHGGFSAVAHGLGDAGVLGAPAAERPHGHPDGLADLGLG